LFARTGSAFFGLCDGAKIRVNVWRIAKRSTTIRELMYELDNTFIHELIHLLNFKMSDVKLANAMRMLLDADRWLT